MRKAGGPAGTKAFQEAWKRHHPSKDTWGLEYVYDFGAYAIWKAAIRHERKKVNGRKRKP